MKMKVEINNFTISQGVHTATIKKIQEMDSSFGKAIKFFFSVNDIEFDLDAEKEPEEPVINGVCSANKLTPSTKLYRWLSAINGGKLDVGAEIDFDKYIGLNVEILVINSEKEGREYSNVTEIIKKAEIPF